MTDYKSKYIKYKNKYLKLKGGAEGARAEGARTRRSSRAEEGAIPSLEDIMNISKIEEKEPPTCLESLIDDLNDNYRMLQQSNTAADKQYYIDIINETYEKFKNKYGITLDNVERLLNEIKNFKEIDRCDTHFNRESRHRKKLPDLTDEELAFF